MLNTEHIKRLAPRISCKKTVGMASSHILYRISYHTTLHLAKNPYISKSRYRAFPAHGNHFSPGSVSRYLSVTKKIAICRVEKGCFGPEFRIILRNTSSSAQRDHLRAPTQTTMWPVLRRPIICSNLKLHQVSSDDHSLFRPRTILRD